MTIFIIAIAFTDWDDCWNYVHKNNLTNAATVCEQITTETLAPITSPRPRARPTE
jgi:hypothetical protein